MEVRIVRAGIVQIHAAQVVQTHLEDNNVGRIPVQNIRQQFFVFGRAVSGDAKIEHLIVGLQELIQVEWPCLVVRDTDAVGRGTPDAGDSMLCLYARELVPAKSI